MSLQTFIPQPPGGLSRVPQRASSVFHEPESPPAAGTADQPPAAWLVSRDTRLIDQVALIAAAAGTELLVGEVAQEAQQRDAVVIVGHDQLERVGQLTAAAVILLGSVEHADQLWQAAARHPGARVAVVPEAAAWLGEYLGERGLRQGAGAVVEFSGLTGGAGTTTLALLTASLAAAAGRSTLLIDADRASSGLGPALGLAGRDSVGLGWQDISSTVGRVPGRQLAEVLPQAAGFSYLTWAAPGDAVRPQTLAEVMAAARQAFEVVVVDAGRCRVGAPRGDAEAPADGSIVVVPAERAWAVPKAVRVEGHHAAVVGALSGGQDVPSIAAAAGLEPLLHVPRLRRLQHVAEVGVPAAARTRAVRRALRPLEAWWTA